jgi:hypothetical protein
VHKDHLVIHKEHGFHNGPYEYLVNTYYGWGAETWFFESLEQAQRAVKQSKDHEMAVAICRKHNNKVIANVE